MHQEFTCSVECNGTAVSADWSIASGTCGSNSSTTQCTTDVSTMVTVSNAGVCNNGTAAINLSYYDLTLECSKSIVHTGSNGNAGEEFSCHATGGNEDYSWIYPNIVQRDSGALEGASTQEFTVSVDSALDFPSDSMITIEVQDGR